MGALILNELRKLKGSLAALLCVVSPTLVVVMSAAMAVRQGRGQWDELVSGSAGLWAFFVLPMSVTALSALLAQIEHGPRAWDHVLALPISRARFFAAKALVMLLLIATMSGIALIETRVAGWALGLLSPSLAPSDAFPWLDGAAQFARMWIASFLMGMIQLWVALRIRSFVAPITLGLGGTFIVVASMGAPEAALLPWMMPVSVLAHDGAGAMLAMALGGIGGAIVLALMIVDMSRKDA